LNCLLWQAAWLAVVLMPPAAVSRCAAADQSEGNGQQQVLAASAGRLHDAPTMVDEECRRKDSRLSTLLRQLGGDGCSSTGEGVRVVLKAAWPSGKSHVSRRGGARWGVASWGSLAATRWLTASAGPVPKASSVLSAEHALLRRLEL